MNRDVEENPFLRQHVNRYNLEHPIRCISQENTMTNDETEMCRAYDAKVREDYDGIKHHRAQEPIEGASNPATAPLIHRTEDKDGNKVVVLAEWFYEELTKETEPIEGLGEDDIKAIAEFKKLYPTWWYKIGWCDISRDFDCAPQGHSPEIVNIKKSGDCWDAGFSCDHRGTLADAIYDVMEQIEAAKRQLESEGE